MAVLIRVYVDISSAAGEDLKRSAKDAGVSKKTYLEGLIEQDRQGKKKKKKK